MVNDAVNDITMAPEIIAFEEMLDSLCAMDLENPYFRTHDGIAYDTSSINGRECINYTGYNYLGFSGDARVSQKAKEAIDMYGTTVSASRPIAGERMIHQSLEREIADFLGVENAVAIISGYATNFSTIGHLFHRKDVILYDEKSHNSIVQGAYLSKAKMIPFTHNDMGDLECLLVKHRRHFKKALIVTEGVFSVDGDIPDLPRIIALKKAHSCAVMVDEAHSLGVLGECGKGITEYFGVNPKDIDILMGTLSKSLASCGGYIAGSARLIRYLKYTLPGFVFSVGLPPTNTVAALTSLRLLKENPERVARLQRNGNFFRERAKTHGLNIGPSRDSGIVPVRIGASTRAMLLSNYLYKNGINVSPMIAPAVPEGEATLRFFIVADHSEEQMVYTLEKVEKGLVLHCQ